MSHNQSRAERGESTQYRKTGRSGSSNLQRQLSGGSTKGGGGPSSAPVNLSNRSFKKNNGNAPVGQSSARNPNVDAGNSPAPRALPNGVHQQQTTNRVSDAPVINTSSNTKPTDAPTPGITRAVPRAPSSNVSSALDPSSVTTSSEPKAPATPSKAPGDASKSLSLQFGSISPGVMNGVQIPARTSSAPPNLDEQKKEQARYESLRTATAKPVPSIPNQHFPKNDAGVLNQPNIGGAQLVAKSKRDTQVSAAPHVTHPQKPSLHPIPPMPMQLPYHQPPVPVQFGGPNPQIQSQGMPGTSPPMPIQMSLPLGNSPVQHPMFVPGLQQHAMQSQGMMHQGQSLNFSPQIGTQLPPQLGNMGMNMAPQFPQQPAIKFSGSRKTVKITHPETHEELRLDTSPAPRLQPNVQSQSQPISSFPPNIPINFYPSSYNATPLFFPAASSVPLNSTQIPPTSQPLRNYNQVTIKPPLGSHGEKELLPTTDSLSVGKAEALKPLKLPGEDSIFPHKETGPSPLSALPQPKAGSRISYASVASSSPVVVERDVPNISASTSHPMDGSASASTSAAEDARIVNAKESLSTTNMATSSEASNLTSEGARKESPEIVVRVESSDHKVSSTSGVLPGRVPEKPEEFSGCSNDVKMDGNIITKETTVGKFDQVEQESVPVSVPCPPEGALRSGNEDIDNNGGVLDSPPSNVKDKVLSDANVAKPRGKKKKKELYRKAEAAGTSSDLYMAYKGPDGKKETVMSAETSEDSSSISDKQISGDVSQENAVPCAKPTEVKVEPDDWEDAAEISTPQLETSKNENKDNDGDGYGLTIKRYSRDFLLKFVEQCTELPEAFEISSDIADSLMVSSVNISRESHPSPGHNIDRPVGGSRPDRRGSGMGDEDKWNKFPGPIMSGRGDMWTDVGYMNNVVGLRPGQGGNYGVLRNSRAQTPVHYAGGILSGTLQFGPQGGLQRNNSDSDRWQRGTGFQKGLMPSPHTPMPVIHKAEKKYEIGKVTDEEEAKQRQLKGILNKLTPQNFEKLFQQVKQVNIDNVITLSGVISQIFDKALMEPTFCEMYANFCFHLAADLPDLSVDNEKITFKRLLLNKCQEEFERGEREEEEANKAEEEGEVTQTAEEREEKRLQARRRMLGNIRLIGELYKKRMLTERIMHECMNKLLGQYQNPDEENIEALCKLMSTIGEMIDHPKAKEHMDAYFDIMAQLSNNMKLSSRVRFMLKDSIDLRKNKWQQRRKVEGPKKIEEVHRDAAQERQAQSSRAARVPSMGNSVRRGPHMDFGPRSPSMLPSPSSHIGGFRAAPPQLRGYGTQDARTEDRYSSENRNISVPLPQRPLGDDSITLGPQGGLARGMAFRGHPSAPSGPLVEMPNPGDARRMGPGQNGFTSIPERAAYGQKEDPRYMPDRIAHPQERNTSYGNREVRNADSSFDRRLPTSQHARDGPPTSTQNVPSDKVWPEELLREKSVAAIKEFYSARDEHEIALCIKELNAPSFYPSMISVWVTDSFERKDVERDLLTKLIINLAKPGNGMISEDQLIRGFGSVLDVLEDAMNDAPRAPEFLGRMFAEVILENVTSLSKIGQLIYEGGEEQGQLVEIGLAAEVLGSILDIIKSEKGESVLNEIRSSCNLRLEDFRPPGSKNSFRIDKFIY